MTKKFFFFAIMIPLSLPSEEQISFLTLLPEKKLVPSFTASGTQHRISYNEQLTRGIFIGSMGGIFPVADIRYHNLLCQISAASSIYTSLQNAGIKFKVTNVDFYVDIFFDIPISEESVLRTGWGHTSHHLADDAIVPGLSPINYARDYYELFFVHRIHALNGFVYGGLYWNYSFLINSNIGRKLLPEFGGESTIGTLYQSITIYTAIDFKFRGELHYGATQSYQIGIKSENQYFRAVRLAYTFRTGVEDRGQFYNLRNSLHTFGVFFDF
jgi:hypothetical protein